MQTEQELIEQQMMDFIMTPPIYPDIDPLEKFAAGIVTITLTTPMDIGEYHRFGLDLVDFMRDQGVMGMVDNETTGEELPVE